MCPKQRLLITQVNTSLWWANVVGTTASIGSRTSSTGATCSSSGGTQTSSSDSSSATSTPTPSGSSRMEQVPIVFSHRMSRSLLLSRMSASWQQLEPLVSVEGTLMILILCQCSPWLNKYLRNYFIMGLFGDKSIRLKQWIIFSRKFSRNRFWGPI